MVRQHSSTQYVQKREIMKCKMCEIEQSTITIEIGDLIVNICEECYEKVIDKYYERMLEELAENYGQKI